MRLLLSTICVLFLSIPLVQADIVDDLYRARVDVEDHGRTQLTRGTRAALAQVFVKVSGSRDVLDSEASRSALAEADRYLQQFSYQRTSDGALELEVQFDQQLVNDLLTAARLPQWSSNRPPVLVWLVVDTRAGRQLATQENTADLLALVRESFDKRGVPVIFPLHDLQDSLALGVHDLWVMDSIAIAQASGRYPAEDILVGRLNQLDGERWMGEWQYLWQSASRGVNEYGVDLEKLVSVGVGLAANSLGERYAVVATGDAGQGVRVRLDGLVDYASYRAGLDFLGELELVEAAIVEYVEGDSVIFRLKVQLQAEQLRQLIELRGQLLEVSGAPPLESGLPPAQLVYLWQP